MQNNIKYLVEDKSNDIDISYFFRTLKKNIKLFISTFLVAFLLLITYLFITHQKEYKASFPVSINNTGSQFVFNDLRDVSKFTKNELKYNLNCTPEELESLNYIQITGIVNEEDKHKAVINISAQKSEIIKQIADKVLAWTEGNEQVKNQISHKKLTINSLINKIEQQLIEIQTIKKKVIDSDNQFQSKVSFTEELEILEKKYQLIEELESIDHVIKYSSQTYIPSKATNSSQKIAIFLSFILSIIIASIVTLIISQKKN